jgi:hypothetical protein
MKVMELIPKTDFITLPTIPSGVRLARPTKDGRMAKALIGAAACILFGALNLAAQSEQIFKGEICWVPGGNAVKSGQSQTLLQCTAKRPRRAQYVLANSAKKTVYKLQGHSKPKAFAGEDVVVIGALDNSTGTIDVSDLFRAFPTKVTKAKSVYIDCDACPRGMAVAWRAAFTELSDWGRFDITPDPRKADLVLIFSANPYLGDYITRDGPDQRPVSVDITYMNVVDPNTGESFWSDSKQWGALLVARATRDLIVEFKQQLQIEEGGGKS